MKKSEVLMKAKAEMQVRPLLKDGRHRDMETGACCTYGALMFVEEGPDSWTEYIPDVRPLLQLALYRLYGQSSIPIWNDRSATTKKEVLALYDYAIKLA